MPRLAAFVILLFLVPALAIAGEAVVYDVRPYKSTDKYFIIFTAEKRSIVDGREDVGHAFVRLGEENAVKQMSTIDAVGFYPTADKDGLRMLLRFEPGRIEDDWRRRADYAVTVQVSRQQMDAAKAVVSRWRSGPTFVLGINDCTTFVGEIASALGLATPFRPLAIYPDEFVNRLGQLLDAREKEKVEAERRERAKRETEKRKAQAAAFAAAEAERERLRQQDEARRRELERQREADEMRRRADRERQAQADAERARAEQQRKEQQAADEKRRQQQEEARRRADQERAEAERRARTAAEQQRQAEEQRRVQEQQRGRGGYGGGSIGGGRPGPAGPAGPTVPRT